MKHNERQINFSYCTISVVIQFTFSCWLDGCWFTGQMNEECCLNDSMDGWLVGWLVGLLADIKLFYISIQQLDIQT